jgi:hypothetical protein
VHTCNNSPSTLAQIHNPKLHLAYALLARLLCLSAPFERMRTKETLYEPPINALLADTSTALLAGTLGSNRETIETHFIILSQFKLKHEIIYRTYKANV